MEQKYRIVAIGLKQGFTRDQSNGMLAALFKRPASELSALTSGKRVTVKKGLEFAAAAKYKSVLEGCGLLADVAPERGASPSRHALTPLPAGDVARIDICARHILATLHEDHGKAAGYDLTSVASIAADLDAGRHGYTSEQSRKISRFYGAFIGKVLADMYAHALPQWVSTADGVAIAFCKTADGQPVLAYPHAAVTDHIEHGDEKSVLAFVQAQRQRVDGEPAETRVDNSVLQLSALEDGDALDIAMPLGMCCNCGTPDDVAVLDVQLSTRTKGESALWMELPFCGACTATADRVRPGTVQTCVATMAAFLVTCIPLIWLTRELRVFGQTTTVLIVPAFALATGAVLYLLDKARSPQTSRYQPVTLESFDTTPAGGRHVGFAFSNADYAHAFAGANAQEISAGRIATVL